MIRCRNFEGDERALWSVAGEESVVRGFGIKTRDLLNAAERPERLVRRVDRAKGKPERLHEHEQEDEEHDEFGDRERPRGDTVSASAQHREE